MLSSAPTARRVLLASRWISSGRNTPRFSRMALCSDVSAAETRIQEAQAAAVGNIGQVAGEVAQAAIQRLIGVEVDQAAAGKAVKATMGGEG